MSYHKIDFESDRNLIALSEYLISAAPQVVLERCRVLWLQAVVEDRPSRPRSSLFGTEYLYYSVEIIQQTTSIIVSKGRDVANVCQKMH
jgi:hypothetical protein